MPRHNYDVISPVAVNWSTVGVNSQVNILNPFNIMYVQVQFILYFNFNSIYRWKKSLIQKQTLL